MNLGNAITKKLAQVSSVEESSTDANPASSPTSSDQSWIEFDHARTRWSGTEDKNGDICYTSKGKAKGGGGDTWNMSPWSKGQWRKG